MAVAVKPTSQRKPRNNADVVPNLSLVPAIRPSYWKAFVGALGVLVVMLLVVSLNVNMAQQQMRLDRLNSDVSRARSHFEELRAQRAQLQSPRDLMASARLMGLVPAMASRTVGVPVEIAAEVAATVGKIDADINASVQSPLDEFGRLKSVVVGNP